MITIPKGSFLIGSPPNEKARDTDEGPQRRISISKRFAISRYEVTRGEYAAFVGATHRVTKLDCVNDHELPNGSWSDQGFAQSSSHPVVCVSWQDAQDYVRWLNGRAGHGGYRLPSEAEWEYAARAGHTSAYPWGDDLSKGCDSANGADAKTACNDEARYTAPVGSYKANAFGLSDMVGNVWEWTQDCYEFSLDATPSDGSAHETSNCATRVVRGGGWNSGPEDLRVAARLGDLSSRRYFYLGFRLAKTLD
jgi:formylglycine-generating enzyme required for sulfatase activity